MNTQTTPTESAIARAFKEIAQCSHAQDGVARELFDSVMARALELTAPSEGFSDTERDARRYRFLRKEASGGTIFLAALPAGCLNCDEPESEWDAAIDAAISAESGGDGS